jgi:GT2 family glycosyltransferase
MGFADARLAVVILNWNGCADTIECLRSVVSSTSLENACLIIVDNHSDDCSVIEIKKWLCMRDDLKSYEVDEINIDTAASPENSNCALIHSSKNRGYAGGNNLGIRFVLRNTPCDYVFVLNNDTSVAPEAIKKIIGWGDSNPEIGIYGPTVLEPRGKESAGGFRYSALLTMGFPVRVNSRRRKIDYVTGAAMVVRTSVIRNIGLLNDQYFLYYEELDYSIRAKAAGIKLGWCPDAVVHHRKGGSTNGGKEKKSVLAEYHANRSCLIFTAKFHRNIFLAAALLRMFSKSIYFLFTARLDLFLPLLKAYRDHWKQGETYL